MDWYDPRDDWPESPTPFAVLLIGVLLEIVSVITAVIILRYLGVI